MEPPPAISPSPRKLRSSCDACGIAKTRCDRNRPKCSRCITLNLSCVYSPSRQVGKRPRRRLGGLRDVARQSTNMTPFDGSGTFSTDSLLGNEGLPDVSASLSSETNVQFDPTQLDPALCFPSLPTTWPEFDGLGGGNDTMNSAVATNVRCGIPPPSAGEFDIYRLYTEPNEILERLTVRGSITEPSAVLVEMSRVLEANRTALESVKGFLKSDFVWSMPHMTMLYASIVARILNWYQVAAGYGHFASRNGESANPESATEARSGRSTMPSDAANSDIAKWTPKCFVMQALPFTIGNFNVDEPYMQLAFRNQVIGHEVKKAGAVIDELISLADDERVLPCDRAVYLALGVWLKGEYEKTTKSLRDAIRYVNERLNI
jgi:hypothetical protein